VQGEGVPGELAAGDDAGERWWRCDMTAGTCRLATSARKVGTITLMFAAASVIMSAMTLTTVAVGLDGSGTLADFTVCLAILTLVALTSTTALTVVLSHRGTPSVQADS
jgi:hypothetical protein